MVEIDQLIKWLQS